MKEYKVGMNKIIHGDSFNILPTFFDKSVDHIITDVPYNFAEHEKQFLHDQFRRTARQWVIVFSPPENQWVFSDIHQYCFWVKPISTINTSKKYSRFVEMLFFYQVGTDCTWNTGRHWSQYPNVFRDLVESREHPYKKPLSLLKRLILNHTTKGDIILDPFAGSFSLLEVCKSTARIFIGIEKEDKYINMVT